MPSKKRTEGLPEGDIAKRLISKYKNDIATDDENNLDYEETLYNFALRIMDDMNDKERNDMFGIGNEFESYDDAYEYLLVHVQSLRPLIYDLFEI